MSGIDYGMGITNIDHATGIRYGVIHANDVGQAWFDSAEPQYGEPHCPECGNEAISYDLDTHHDYEDAWCNDYACEHCERGISSDEAYPDEALSYTYENDGYACEQGDYDIFVVKSPFYTLASFCSPCAPGAGYLGSEGDVKTYCFNHDWFEDGKAPYRVFRVEDDSEVFPDSK